MNLKIITFLFLALNISESYAECKGKPIGSKTEIVINKINASSRGFKVTVSEPITKNEDFYSIKIEFPKKHNKNFSYVFSKALYSKDGKRLLSYKPRDFSFQSSSSAEVYIAASSEVISCLSLVNIYSHNTIIHECPPTESITIDLASFINTKLQCKKLHADNYY